MDCPDHIAQALHNEDSFSRVDQVQDPDWAAVVLFYTALHFMDAFLAYFHADHPVGHSQRGRSIRERSTLRGLWAAYQNLQNLSFNCRYYAHKPSAGDLERAEQKLQLIRQAVKAGGTPGMP